MERQDHWYLTPEHFCYFFGEYTSRGGYSHSSTNQIITNIKKKPSLQGTPQWQYKVRAMQQVAAAVRSAIDTAAYARVTLVPIPPSKLRTDPEYDARMAWIARAVSPQINVRELIEPVAARVPLHESDQRLHPDALMATLRLQESLSEPTPQEIILIDDVITTGCSFVACRALLQQRYPGVTISGIFAARRALDRTIDFPALPPL